MTDDDRGGRAAHRSDAQCNFQPLLEPNTPALCADQKNPPVIYLEDFEDGLGGWTLTNQGVFAGWPGTNWVSGPSLPGRPRRLGGLRARTSSRATATAVPVTSPA